MVGASGGYLELKRAVLGVLAELRAPTHQPPSVEEVRACVAGLRPLCSVEDAEADALVRDVEATLGVSIGKGSQLVDEASYRPWLHGARGAIDWYYWNRYRSHLERRLPLQVVLETDRITDKVLNGLQNPARDGPWDRRGMVIGHVQSGKTSNYIGLACKAADAGYRVIVVIAGLQDSLRTQTQRRVDEGLIGFDSARTVTHRVRKVGVGRIVDDRQPAALTTSLGDFDTRIADKAAIPLANLREPLVLVIKKNAAILQNLVKWLAVHNRRQGASQISAPMLLIDDEADNASINVASKKDEVSRINGLIRKLLGLFERSAYVGYTATPFANIFIDPDSEDEMVGHDLFPRDFIFCLDAPSNYFGPTRVFGERERRVVRLVDDHADLLPLHHRKDWRPEQLPRSLKQAVRVFVLARAIRLTRPGQERAHNSMMVNVSRFVAVQGRVRELIHRMVDDMRQSVRVNGGLPPNDAIRDPVIRSLRELFRKEYESHCGVSWPEVLRRLHDSVSAVRVVEVNSSAKEPLDYAAHEENWLNVIAVGGLSLSRGLTLEGLTVSYLLRNTVMYDTLMQMGRWFGYRPGYEDLCRVWLPDEAAGSYAHIGDSIEELRADLGDMQRAGAMPSEFGLRVRSHPDSLIVTARNKMGSGQQVRARIGLANKFVETVTLDRRPDVLRENLEAAKAFAREVRSGGKQALPWPERGGGHLVGGVPCAVIERFIDSFRSHQAALKTQRGPILAWLAGGRRSELATWDVLLPGVHESARPSRQLVFELAGFRLVCQRRTPGNRSDEGTLFVTNRQRVSSRGAERAGLDQKVVEQAEADYRSSAGDKASQGNYPDRIYRSVRRRPLLILHLLAIGKHGEDLSGEQPVVAWSMSLPRTEREQETVEYVVNATWFKQAYGDELGDEEGESPDGT